VQEVIGGIGLGLALGYVVFRLMKGVDDYSVEVLLTLALVFGGSALAALWHLSGPLAVVVAGLFLGNTGRRLAMSEETANRLDQFWELLDEIFTAVLFVWIGLELAALHFDWSAVAAGLAAIPIALAARFVAVGSIVNALKLRREFSPGAVRIVTWAGLRGGISIALAMSLPLGEVRDLLLPAAYVVIVFSILVQGLSLPTLVHKVQSENV
jgi:CPA1 family monovalent cation:H+ antiporter